MDRTLTPELDQYVRDRVASGEFASADDVVAAALLRMKEQEELAFDDETLAALDRSRAKLDRGEGIPLETVKDEWRKRLGGL